jgi:DNA-binding response OmpR family regulator
MLCARGEWPHVPIILVSENEESMGELATACGAFGVLSKPLDLSVLLNRLRNAIELSVAS